MSTDNEATTSAPAMSTDNEATTSAPTLDLFDAVMLAEGATDGTEEEVLAAWQLLVDTGAAWTLQGFFGRTARALLQAGRIQPAGQRL